MSRRSFFGGKRSDAGSSIPSSLVYDQPAKSGKGFRKRIAARFGSTSIFSQFIHDVDDSDSTSFVGEGWTIPHKVVLGFDFYKLYFLSLENRDFDVSVLQVILSFQKLSRLLRMSLSPESIEGIVSMHRPNSDVIRWKEFLQYIMGFEKRQKFAAQKSRNSDDESSSLNLRMPTQVLLSLPERIFLTMEEPSSSLVAHMVSILRVLVILLSTLGLVLESLPSFRHPPMNAPLAEPVPDEAFGVIEAVTIAFFTFDFLVRFCIVGVVRMELLDKRELVRLGTRRGPIHLATTVVHRIVRFLLLPMSIVDLISIAPFFVALGVEATGGDVESGGFQIARVIRLVGVLRLLRMKQFKDIQEILRKAFSNSMEALAILIFVFGIVVLFFAVIIFFPEGGQWYEAGSIINGSAIASGGYYREQPVDSSLLELTPFTSIPAAIWYAVVSATTVGYGDMVPTSVWGKLIGGCLALTGLVVLAMPIAVVGSNFSTEYTKFYAIRGQLMLSKEADMHATMMEKFHRDHGVDGTVHTPDNHDPQSKENHMESLRNWVIDDDEMMPILGTMQELHADTQIRMGQVSEAVRCCLDILTNIQRSDTRKTAIEKLVYEIALDKLVN